MIYAPGTDKTWAKHRGNQVAVVGKEHKCAFTATLGLSASGNTIPFHAVFQGKTSRLCPRWTAKNSEAFKYASEHRFKFLPSKIDMYWVTMETLKEYIAAIVENFEGKIESLGFEKA